MHTVSPHCHAVVIDNVPAEVCPVCGNVLLKPETVAHIEQILQARMQPTSTVPLYNYA